MNIPESEKQVLADFKFHIPKISKEKMFDPYATDAGFFVENGHITHLILIGLKLLELPNSIGDLKELRFLRLDSNQLINLPKSFQNLINLEILFLDRNKFTSFPDCLENLKNLVYLSLWNNQLNSLPDWLGNLKGLRSLILFENNLHSLPEAIGNLENLETVSLSSNKIPILPESFRKLKNLESLHLKDTGLCSFSNIPKELIDSIDTDDDSWPWTCFTQGNFPSEQAKRIIDSNLYRFWKYYCVSPLELAQKYVQDQNSLTAEEKERLAWEGGFRERNIIEMGGIKPDDPILAEINNHLIFTCDNGLKLMK